MITQGSIDIWLLTAAEELVRRNEELTAVTFPPHFVFHICLVGYSERLWEMANLKELLWRDGHVPAVADIAIAGILTDKTIIEILPSGREWVSDSLHTWGGQKTGPFKPMNWCLQFLPPTFRSGFAVPGPSEFSNNATLMIQRYGCT